LIIILHENANSENVNVIGSNTISPFKNIFFIVPKIRNKRLLKKLNIAFVIFIIYGPSIFI